MNNALEALDVGGNTLNGMITSYMKNHRILRENFMLFDIEPRELHTWSLLGPPGGCERGHHASAWFKIGSANLPIILFLLQF